MIVLQKQSFSIRVESTEEYLDLKCLDEDIDADDLVGRLVLKITDIITNGGIDSHLDMNGAGELHIKT